MIKSSETAQEIFVAVRVGKTWRVMDTRSGTRLGSGPLDEVEATSIASLLTRLANDLMTYRSLLK
jgi:hypothetical protein